MGPLPFSFFNFTVQSHCLSFFLSSFVCLSVCRRHFVFEIGGHRMFISGFLWYFLVSRSFWYLQWEVAWVGLALCSKLGRTASERRPGSGYGGVVSCRVYNFRFACLLVMVAVSWADWLRGGLVGWFGGLGVVIFAWFWRWVGGLVWWEKCCVLNFCPSLWPLFFVGGLF